MSALSPDEFAFLAAMLKRRSGLIVSPDKGYLLESRLLPIARKEQVAGLSGLVARLRGPGSEALQRAVTDAMTTNESLFFRDRTPFDQFEKEMLPTLMAARAAQRRLRIWCAAASTGQEPYSLAMILKEKAVLTAGWSFDILGTDISADVLARAQAGLYSQFEVQRGLPIQMLVKYFTKEGDSFRLNESIRSMAKFRLLNLLESFAGLGQQDIVFCRNVLIYFDRETKVDILTRIAALLPADGYLLLGSAETVVGMTVPFQPHPTLRGVYTKTAATGAAAARAAG